MGSKDSRDIVIVGGGAAGFFAGMRAAHYLKDSGKAGSVTILEASQQVLKKVRISGGGRCNVTHNQFQVREFCQNYPRGQKELLSPMQSFQAQDTVKWFEERGVEIVPESDGRMFPAQNTSEAIIDCFQSEISKYKIQVLKGCPVSSLSKQEDDFLVEIKNKESIKAKQILLATGSGPGGYKLSESFGHKITDRAPSLFSFKIDHPLIDGLEGLSFRNAVVLLKTPKGKKFLEKGPCLITHWGLSGPGILKISAWAAREMKECGYQAELKVNWLGLSNVEEALLFLKNIGEEGLKVFVKNKYPLEIPKRFWLHFLDFCKVSPEKRWGDVSKKEYSILAKNLIQTEFEVLGKNRFKDEFVECGGVDLKEVHFKTLESKKCSGLHFAGELLDVDGVTGGFNFQNAWTTGWLAGTHMADSL